MIMTSVHGFSQACGKDSLKLGKACENLITRNPANGKKTSQCMYFEAHPQYSSFDFRNGRNPEINQMSDIEDLADAKKVCIYYGLSAHLQDQANDARQSVVLFANNRTVMDKSLRDRRMPFKLGSALGVSYYTIKRKSPMVSGCY